MSNKKAQRTQSAVSSKPTKFRCLTLHQAGHQLAVFIATAPELALIVKVNKREPDENKGYQRALSMTRVDAIARYLKGSRPMPTALVVAFETATIDRGYLLVPAGSIGWVIDGQHRLAGARQTGSPIELPVVAFVDLDVEAQIEQFVTINKEAKGVPSSLYLDLLQHLPGKRSESEMARERAVDLARELKGDDESAFFGRIAVMESPKRGELSLTNFVRKAAPLVNRNQGLLGAYTEKEQRLVLNNYYKALSNVFPDEFDRPDSIFYQTLGFGAALNALPVVFALTLKATKGFRVSDAVSVLTLVADLELDSWRQMGSGNAVEREAGEWFAGELQRRANLSAGEDDGSLVLSD